MSTSTTLVRVSGPNSTRTFRSIRAAARSLSGNGVDTTERTRSVLRRRLAAGGGFIGRVYVENV